VAITQLCPAAKYVILIDRTFNLEQSVPKWWREAIALEYLECRDFSKGTRIAKIDFSLVSQDQIDDALKKHRIVCHGVLVHNVDEATFRTRTAANLFSSIARPIVNGDKEAIFPQGLVSNHHFPWLANPIEVIDPIEEFGSHIQVWDQGKLYQWEVARFEGVAERHYGRWVSDYVNLEGFDETYDDFQNLLRLKSKLGASSEEYQTHAKSYVSRLKKLRADAFEILMSVHEELKNTHKSSIGKVAVFAPPVMSKFETMKIENGEMHTMASMAPIFYRAAHKHCYSAGKLDKSTQLTPAVLDQIYEERAQALIISAACLEAVMNELGDAKHPDVWGTLEKLSVIEKWGMLCKMSHGRAVFDASCEPMQSISKIVGARNEMIHFKPGYRKVTVKNGEAVSKLGMTLSKELIDRLPKVLFDGLTQIYVGMEMTPPDWLQNQPGWSIHECE
jgi:hypothetical protein